MLLRTKVLSDGTDTGQADSPDSSSDAPGDRNAAPIVAAGSDGEGRGPVSDGGGAPGSGDDAPGSSGGPPARGGSGPQPPLAGAGATFDADGSLTSWTVSDVGDTQPWSMFRTYYDAQGNVVSQIGLNDGGSFWINVYDPGRNRFDQYTNYYDGAGHLVSHTQANLDGTHTLTVFDTTDSQTWSTFTMTFDANWNQTSLTGTNHDGTHTIDAGAIGSFMDTLTWYAKPYVVDGASPPTDGRGSPADLAATLPTADPRAADPFAAALVALQDSLAAENARGSPTSDLPALGSSGGDAFTAFLNGLQGLSSDGGGGVPSAGSAGPPATLLSSGLNADAGVAQLVSALASVRDGSSAFDATPFSAPSDPTPQGIVAPALR